MNGTENWRALIEQIRSSNPTGRGRPYSIPLLIERAWGKRPQRIRDDRRLELAFRLDDDEIGYDRLLEQGARTTRLWVKSRSGI